MLAYVGIPQTDPWYQDALGALANHWNYNASPSVASTWDGGYWPWWPTFFGPTPSYTQNAVPGYPYEASNYYAMYGIAKALRIARNSSGNVSQVTQVGSHDWYSELSSYLVCLQQTESDGRWPGFFYWDSETATPFALLVLEPTVARLRPVASISASPNPVNAGTTVNFDISGSTHQDPAKFLVSWKLIFDTTSGATWATPDVSGTFPVTGPIPKVGVTLRSRHRPIMMSPPRFR